MTQTCTAERAAEVALAALKAMVAIADETLEEATGRLTLTQFRALRTAVDRTPVTMGRVAAELAIDPSSVTRACDRLAALDLLRRAPNPLNKRETLIAPTAAGRQLVARVDHDRRAVLGALLARLPDEDRATVVAAFERFAAVAAEESAPEATV